jgi:CO dehydrogenase maturation factor
MALTETDDFDLLVMGRQEGPGCYCYINNILRSYVDTLSENYDFVIIDNEAGMEHLSRRTTKRMEVLFVVSDASKIGIETAGRIRELAGEMELKIGKYVMIVNRTPESALTTAKESASDLGFDDIFMIPKDDDIEAYNLEGKSLLTLPENSKASNEVAEIVDKVISKN